MQCADSARDREIFLRYLWSMDRAPRSVDGLSTSHIFCKMTDGIQVKYIEEFMVCCPVHPSGYVCGFLAKLLATAYRRAKTLAWNVFGVSNPCGRKH